MHVAVACTRRFGSETAAALDRQPLGFLSGRSARERRVLNRRAASRADRRGVARSEPAIPCRSTLFAAPRRVRTLLKVCGVTLPDIAMIRACAAARRVYSAFIQR